MSVEKCRSWFCVWNNPQEEYKDYEPSSMCETVLEIWIDNDEHRTGAVAYCISEKGLIHLHMVLEDSRQSRFSAIKKAFPKAHIEPTRGCKADAEDYINKRGRFAEKGEKVVYIASQGEIKGAQGKRNDLAELQDLLDKGLTPCAIMSLKLEYRRYEKMLRDAFFDKRKAETPLLRDLQVIWHVGESGSGKTYSYIKACEKYGEDEVYLVTDYDNGGLDKYCGEKVLYLDEFRGQIRYSTLLAMLQGYKQQFHARYTNIVGLWNEVHIATVLPPDMVYSNMVSENKDVDTMRQLYRRINTIIYHYKDNNGYHAYEMDFAEYKGLEDLKKRSGFDGFVETNGETPFE